MPVNKVVFGAVAIMDISDSTVTEDTLGEGATAYDKAGNKITGKMKAGVELPALTSPGAAADLRTGKQLIDKDGNVVEGSMPTATQATPGITVSSGGLITASATQSAGYVTAGTKSATKQLTTQAAKTITPSKSTQTAVASGRYTTGAITVGAIPSQYIVPSGTKSITANGTHDVESYASVNVAVPTEDLNTVLTEQEALITELETVLAGKAAGGGGASVEYSVTFVNVPSRARIVYTIEYNGQMLIDDAGLDNFTYKTKSSLIVVYDVETWTADSSSWSVSDGVIIQNINEGGFTGGFMFIDVSQTGGECTIEYLG